LALHLVVKKYPTMKVAGIIANIPMMTYLTAKDTWLYLSFIYYALLFKFYY